MRNIRLTQIDGKLPNLALMRLAKYYRERGDQVWFSRAVNKELFEPSYYDRVYGSIIFTMSSDRTRQFKRQFPMAIIGGTGSGNWDTLESLHPGIPEKYDYRDYPEFTGSIGFLQRGCRLRCKFCVVPEKEGRPEQEHDGRRIVAGRSAPPKAAHPR